MKIYLTNVLVSYVAFIILDVIWLKLIAGGFFTKHLAFIGRMTDGRMTPNLLSAAIVYVFMSLALVFFVNMPFGKESLGKIFLVGAFFGLTMYAVFEFTNHAIIDNWPTQIIFVDLAWGSFMCGTVAVITHLFQQKFLA